MESRRDGKPRNVPQGVASGLKASHGFGLALDYKSMAGLYDGLRGSGFVTEKAYYALIAPAPAVQVEYVRAVGCGDP